MNNGNTTRYYIYEYIKYIIQYYNTISTYIVVSRNSLAYGNSQGLMTFKYE